MEEMLEGFKTQIDVNSYNDQQNRILKTQNEFLEKINEIDKNIEIKIEKSIEIFQQKKLILKK